MEKSFSYRFENILDIKEKLENERKSELGKAVQRLEAAEKALREWIERKKQAKDDWNKQARSVQKVRFFQQSGHNFEYFDKMIQRETRQVEERKKEVAEARKKLLNAKKDTKIFEKLKEKDYESHRLTEQRKENELIDQIVTHKSSRK
ncbi:flagellar export protein FliJ [Isachenkonia alkalipeptolytica]|uniref:Flagellar FliJ protein n=1 Tax=Isachenkonia alkalipeptolytica TaxID=2565777 RepID=A0AA44BEH7_9CLOT|nr:flagellar export protein FliJ [Isachenkonia alkalipeptolytica]NBG87566.1 flagellar export protein FliJ [Isachenkonia alkalipeptolytica]